MTASSVFLDAFGRVRDTLHRTLPDLTEAELHGEPLPGPGWLAWRLTRVMDNNISRLGGNDQLWVGSGWAQRFGMPPEPYDFGRGQAHTREQVRAFKAPSDLILAYHDATFDRARAYFESVTDQELERELDEPQYNPLPTVSVRLVSVLENAMNNAGQISYLKAYHRLGGWFPHEAPDPANFR
jgi:hypothetical protein